MEPNTSRWLDVDSPNFQKVWRPIFQRKIIDIGVEEGIIKADRAGYLWKDGKPFYIEYDGELVQLRYAAKAVNWSTCTAKIVRI